MAIKYLTDVDLNNNELQNAVVQNLATAPSGLEAGRIWFNTADHYLYYYNGTTSIPLGELPAGTAAMLTAGTDTTNRIWQAKILHDYIAAAIGAADAMRFKGTLGTGGTITALPTSGVQVGDTYRVITAGTYAGQTCEVGDLIIALTTTPTWTVAQTNIEGAVTTADAATTTPIVAGTGAAGSSTKYARADHVHPAQTSVSGNAGTATTLQTARYIDGVSFNGSADIAHWGTCTISGSAGTLPCTGFSLKTGAWVAAFFPTTNLTTSTDPLLLNVNGTGGKEVKYYSGSDTSIPANANIFCTNRTYLLVYDGSAYRLVGDLDTSTEYMAGTAAHIRSGSVTQEMVWAPSVLHNALAVKYTATNPELTPSGGVATWTVTHNLGTQYGDVSIYEVSSKAKVIADVVATSTSAVTIKIISTSTIAAGTYQVVVQA